MNRAIFRCFATSNKLKANPNNKLQKKLKSSEPPAEYCYASNNSIRPAASETTDKKVKAEFLYGINAVTAALCSGKRTFLRLYRQSGTSRLIFLIYQKLFRTDWKSIGDDR